MKITDVADKVAQMCYDIKEEGSQEHAVQLFVEATVLPAFVTNYSKDALAHYIQEHLGKVIDE